MPQQFGPTSTTQTLAQPQQPNTTPGMLPQQLGTTSGTLLQEQIITPETLLQQHPTYSAASKNTVLKIV